MDTAADIESRIFFYEAEQCMEVDFTGFHLVNSVTVNRVYDAIENAIAKSGEDRWFFLVNYSNSRIEDAAWPAFARRGRILNLTHSQGSVRFDASEATRRQIEESANTDSFDANLFADRESALHRIAELPSKRSGQLNPSFAEHELEHRVSFDPEAAIMEVDFSHFTFHHGQDVDYFVDYIEDRIRTTDRKWFILVNYNDCQILPAAWVVYAARAKDLCATSSLGSVRYAAGSETRASMRKRVESNSVRTNIRNTRAEALERLHEMQAELAEQSCRVS